MLLGQAACQPQVLEIEITSYPLAMENMGNGPEVHKWSGFRQEARGANGGQRNSRLTRLVTVCDHPSVTAYFMKESNGKQELKCLS